MSKQLTLLETLEVVQALYKKYGRKLELKQFLQEIAHVSQEVTDVIVFLVKNGSLNGQKIDKLILQLKKQHHAKINFVIKGGCDVESQHLVDFLEKKFENVEVVQVESIEDDLQLSVKGGGYVFARSLDGDLEKLLA